MNCEGAENPSSVRCVTERPLTEEELKLARDGDDVDEATGSDGESECGDAHGGAAVETQDDDSDHSIGSEDVESEEDEGGNDSQRPSTAYKAREPVGRAGGRPKAQRGAAVRRSGRLCAGHVTG